MFFGETMINLKKRFTVQNYNVGIVDKTVLEKGIQANSIKWLKHSYKDRFFADPFLWYQDEVYYYVFAEEMCYFEEYGKIVLLTVDKENFILKEREEIIKEPFHLSFPFCEENGNLITPEAAQSKKCTQYYICKKTHKIIEKKVISDTGIIDPIFSKIDSQEVILGSKVSSPKDELYLYSKDSTGKFNIISEKPIRKGRECSKNAGGLFEYKEKLYRPVQVCTNRYGEATSIMEIVSFSKDVICEKEILRVSANENPPFYETLHTFNVYDDIILVDGSIDVFGIRNIYYKAKKFLKRKFSF